MDQDKLTPEQAADAGLVAFWSKEIDLYDRKAQDWVKRSGKIIKRYEDEREGGEVNTSRFNILWSNVETLKPAYYARDPKPEVERRYKDSDPVGRVASEVLERSISFAITKAFPEVMRQTVLDLLLPGRGVVWVRYVPHFRDMEIKGSPEVEEDGEEVADDTEIPQEVSYEECLTDYVHWKDFGHTVARTWQEVRAVWRIVYLTRDELIKRFGEKGREVPLSYKPEGTPKDDESMNKGVVYEIWDKTKKEALWICKDAQDGALDRLDDPLGLDGFFPCARPLFSTITNESLIPKPDYVMYQDQAMELDDLTARINSISKSLKVAGVYDSSNDGIQRLLSEGIDNKLIPVDGWAAMAEKGGLQNAIAWLPIEQVANVLISLYEARDKVKNDLYEITGIADIIRGATEALETATAQQIKGQFATLRLSDRQREVQRFARDTIRIIGEVIARHFSMDTIREICGIKLLTQAQKAGIQQQMQQQAMMSMQAQQAGQQAQPPQLPDDIAELMQQPTWEEIETLLRDNAHRNFRIDIETDSTIKLDEDAEKQARLEFLEASGKFIQQMLPMIEQVPQAAPLAGEMMMFGVRSFRAGKSLEAAFETFLKEMEKTAKNPPPKQDPKVLQVQAQSQAKQQEMQMNMQIRQQEIQMEAQQAQAEHAYQAQVEQHRNELEAQREAMKQQNAMALEQMKMHMEGAMQQQQAALDAKLDLMIAHIKAAAQIEAARVTAQASDGADAEAREAAGEQ